MTTIQFAVAWLIIGVIINFLYRKGLSLVLTPVKENPLINILTNLGITLLWPGIIVMVIFEDNREEEDG